MGNYSFKTTGLPDPVDGLVQGHNFTQATPHTAIYVGQTGLTFRSCNLLNCDVPAGSVVENCQNSQVSFCSHLNPDMVTLGGLAVCDENCTHVVTYDTVTIDGVSVQTNYTYEDKGVT